jgi:hypothetical protein
MHKAYPGLLLPQSDTMSYVRGLNVVYDDSSNAVDGEDINNGFGGECINRKFA